jgi:hypothetical protein
MRPITDHEVNECNKALIVAVLDEPGAGGASHRYAVQVPADAKIQRPTCVIQLYFQDGPIKEVGTNGITHEVLLAIVIDRLRSFQKGDYACRENALALTKIEEAMHWLNHRTQQRMARGVEGTHAK